MKKLTSIVVVIFLISILKAFSYGQGDSAAVNPNHPPIERDERLSRRFPHSKNEMDFTEKRDILSERMEHHKEQRTGTQKQSNSNDIEPEWVSHYASGLIPADAAATDIAVDNLGNVYVTGYSTRLPFRVDYFTTKYDDSGNLIWSVRYNNGDDRANAIAVDGSGNVYVTGYSSGSGTDYDYATVKYNSSGEEQWVARYNGPGIADEANAIAVDGSGNVYVTGASKGSNGYTDYATVKYNSEGQEQWAARYDGPGNSYDEANAIAVDGSGNVYVTGESERDYATVKYNSDGVEQWVARYNGPGNSYDEANAIAVDRSGNVYVTGGSEGSGTSYDYATVKYNSLGVEEWVARYDGQRNSGDYARAIAVDGSGNVYVTGESHDLSTMLKNSWGYATVKYNSEGEVQWIASRREEADSRSNAIAVDGSGNVYVIDKIDDSGTRYDYEAVKYNSSGVWQWAARYDGPGNSSDEANAIAVDGSGNVYVTGSSKGSGTEDDYATVKYNSGGEEEWVARYNGPENADDEARAIAVDGSGNVYVTGVSWGSDTEEDYATVKYNSEGAQQWVARYDGPGNDYDEAYAIAVDGSGNVYVTGESEGSGTSRDYATVKYNSKGEEQWVARYNGPINYGDEATAIAVDGSGNVYVTGESEGSGTSRDYATVKYNSEGEEQWVARYNGPGNSDDKATAIAVDGSGNVYVTGYGYGSGTKYDYATVKYNSEGEEEWVARYNGPGNIDDYARAIAVDGSGNVYVTGDSKGSGAHEDYATVKYNSAGEEEWVARYNGPGNIDDYAKSIAVDGSGNVYVTGKSRGSSTSYDYATVKYNSEGQEGWVARYDGLGNGDDYANAIAVDGSGNVYVTGYSRAGDWSVYTTIKYSGDRDCR